jgi:hypothetical protein
MCPDGDEGRYCKGRVQDDNHGLKTNNQHAETTTVSSTQTHLRFGAVADGTPADGGDAIDGAATGGGSIDLS